MVKRIAKSGPITVCGKFFAWDEEARTPLFLGDDEDGEGDEAEMWLVLFSSLEALVAFYVAVKIPIGTDVKSIGHGPSFLAYLRQQEPTCRVAIDPVIDGSTTVFTEVDVASGPVFAEGLLS
jgi:hypothetical protein